MSRAMILDLAVGAFLSVHETAEVAAAAHDAGMSAVRLLDAGAAAVLDPSTVASYLAGRLPEVRWIVDARTTHNPPYNLARRVLAIDRATAGRAGLALRAGDGDEVSDSAVPDPPASARGRRWAEYAEVLTRLWQSFPARALLGDQAAGEFAEVSLVQPINHEGDFYRIAGPLDGPSSPQGRPVLVAADMDQLAWDDVARTADVVTVNRAQARDANAELARALSRIGRQREEVVLIGRTQVAASEASAGSLAAELDDWAASNGLDGLELRPAGGRDAALAVVQNVVLRFEAATGTTLRAALGLPELIGAR